MDMKRAIELIKHVSWNAFGNYGYDNNEEEFIELLQRGEKFEFIFSDMHSLIQHLLDGIYLYNIKLSSKSDADYIAKAFEIIKEKYFPKPMEEKTIFEMADDLLWKAFKEFIENNDELILKCAIEVERRKNEKINEAQVGR